MRFSTETKIEYVSRAQQRDEMREQMPTVAAAVDEFRKVFGSVRVTYAEENGRKAGTDTMGEIVGIAHDGALIATAKH